MKVLFDTSVLVAAFVPKHPFHDSAYPLFRRACQHEFEWCISQHSLAETFRVLTSMPSKPRLVAADAIQMFDKDIYPTAEIVSMDSSDYKALIQRLADLQLVGGIIFDAIIVCAAQKAKADHIYTFNPAHFHRVWPERADAILKP